VGPSARAYWGITGPASGELRDLDDTIAKSSNTTNVLHCYHCNEDLVSHDAK
jgi:hypothetical protein